jgi:hypothetical protein
VVRVKVVRVKVVRVKVVRVKVVRVKVVRVKVVRVKVVRVKVVRVKVVRVKVVRVKVVRVKVVRVNDESEAISYPRKPPGTSGVIKRHLIYAFFVPSQAGKLILALCNMSVCYHSQLESNRV